MNTDVIRLLPDSVANQIAAGEVIQRPASVIKELVENAVDAGATEISIILKDAGRTLVQVVDNGCGMSPTDARMAFERHATSKISCAADLFTLTTMGFRGEALPSIAAVAQVELRTMQRDAEIGTRLLINESAFESQEPFPMVPGTNMMVKNIFFHLPARRKFLKKDSVELNQILREFERLALVNTGVDFTLISDGHTLHRFGPGNLKQRIGALFGKNMEGQMAHVETETPLVKIDGFIGMPRFARKRGYQQFFFVNGRNMRHPVFHRAILKCYEQLISPDSQPSYFINFTVDPGDIDVNIHPQKYEVKFAQEQLIWQVLEAAVRETLGKNQAAGALDFDSDDAPEIPVFNPGGNDVPADDFNPDYNPFRPASDNAGLRSASDNRPATSYTHRPAQQSVPHDWEKLYESFSQRRDDAFASAPADGLVDDDTLIPERPDAAFPGMDHEAEAAVAPPSCFQLHNRYIVSSSQTGVMVISQHRAHIRILFDGYMRDLAEGNMSSQILIFPEDMELSPACNALLTANLKDFEALGFGLRDNGKMRWSVTAVPSPLQSVSPIETVVSMLEDVAEMGEVNASALRAPLALSMARNAAVQPGQALTTAEMDSIVADLFRCSDPSHTPDGQTVMTVFSNDEIASRFSR